MDTVTAMGLSLFLLPLFLILHRCLTIGGQAYRIRHLGALLVCLPSPDPALPVTCVKVRHVRLGLTCHNRER